MRTCDRSNISYHKYFIIQCRKYFVIFNFVVLSDYENISTTKISRFMVLSMYVPIGRSRRCNQCSACLRKDCGKCKFCKDKLKFGGKGVKKQCCIKRRCMNSKSISQNPAQKLATNSTTQLTDITNTLGKYIPQ